MRHLRLRFRLSASQRGTRARAGGTKGPYTPLRRRTRDIENRGTMETVSSSARKVSSSGVSPACRAFGRAMGVGWGGA
jgi:hypothetical protein